MERYNVRYNLVTFSDWREHSGFLGVGLLDYSFLTAFLSGKPPSLRGVTGSFSSGCFPVFVTELTTESE